MADGNPFAPPPTNLTGQVNDLIKNYRSQQLIQQRRSALEQLMNSGDQDPVKMIMGYGQATGDIEGMKGLAAAFKYAGGGAGQNKAGLVPQYYTTPDPNDPSKRILHAGQFLSGGGFKEVGAPQEGAVWAPPVQYENQGIQLTPTYRAGGGIAGPSLPVTGKPPPGYVPPPGYDPYAPSQPGTQPGQTTPQAQGSYMPGTTEEAKASQARQQAQAIPRGQENISNAIYNMGKQYSALIATGGAIVPGASQSQNVKAWIASTPQGQAINTARGTPEQSLRNSINAARPGLIASMRAASGLSARSLDSNIELQFYMQQVGDVHTDAYASLAALDAFERAYGKKDSSSLQKALPKELYDTIRNRADALMASRPRTLDALAAMSPEAAQAAAADTQKWQQQGQQAPSGTEMAPATNPNELPVYSAQPPESGWTDLGSGYRIRPKQ